MLENYLLMIVTSDGVLLDNQKAEYLIADKGYDSHHVVDVDANKGIQSRNSSEGKCKQSKEL